MVRRVRRASADLLTLVPALFGFAAIVNLASMLFIDEPAERFLLGRA